MIYKYFTLSNPAYECIYRLPDGAFIPKDTNNCDYKNYSVWRSLKNNINTIIPIINSPDDAQIAALVAINSDSVVQG